jgi:hypothetical protein
VDRYDGLLEGYNMTDFQSLGLSETLLKAVASEGYTSPTPVQEQSIPPLLEGRDVLGVFHQLENWQHKSMNALLPTVNTWTFDIE